MTAPTASVCIPVFNGARWLGETLQSVRAQTFLDREVVVCDNCSTDDSPAIARAFSEVRYVRNERNVGQAGNWNRCLAEARGEFVVVLHADDLLRPSFLEETVRLAESDPGIGLVNCGVELIDGNGAVTGRVFPWDETRVDPPGVLLDRLLTEGCLVNPAGVLVPRKVHDELGPFRDDVTWGVDWDRWSRIAMKWKTAFVARPLAAYRQHAFSGTSRQTAVANARDELKVLNSLLESLPIERGDLRARADEFLRALAHRTWCFAELHAMAGQGNQARSGLRAATSLDPSLRFRARSWALWISSFVGVGWWRAINRSRARLGPNSLTPR